MSENQSPNDTHHASRPSGVMLAVLAAIGVGFILLVVYSKEIEAYLTAGSRV